MGEGGSGRWRLGGIIEPDASEPVVVEEVVQVEGRAVGSGGSQSGLPFGGGIAGGFGVGIGEVRCHDLRVLGGVVNRFSPKTKIPLSVLNYNTNKQFSFI